MVKYRITKENMKQVILSKISQCVDRYRTDCASESLWRVLTYELGIWSCDMVYFGWKYMSAVGKTVFLVCFCLFVF